MLDSSVRLLLNTHQLKQSKTADNTSNLLKFLVQHVRTTEPKLLDWLQDTSGIKEVISCTIFCVVCGNIRLKRCKKGCSKVEYLKAKASNQLCFRPLV